MMIRVLFLILMIMGLSAARAEDSWPSASLFYTPDEARQIDAAVSLRGERQRSMLHLDAIMYTAPDQWIFWLNGRRWSPESVDGHLRVVDVTRGSVRLNLDGSEITLQPQQTYWLDRKTVTEGAP